MDERKDIYLKDEVYSEIDKFLSKPLTFEKNEEKKQFNESASLLKDEMKASKSSLFISGASNKNIQEGTWSGRSSTGPKIKSHTKLPAVNVNGSPAVYSSDKWKSSAKVLQDGNKCFTDDQRHPISIVERNELTTSLVRGGPKRKSTLKSLGRFLKRHLGLKDTLPDYRQGKAFSASSHHNESETSMNESLHFDDKIDANDRRFFSNSSPHSRRRFSSVRVKHEQSWPSKSDSRTSLSKINGDSWQKDRNFVWDSVRYSDGLKPGDFRVNEYRKLKKKDEYFFNNGSVKERRKEAEEEDSGVDSPTETKIYSDFSSPCLRGIKNVGNTCFINSVLQCLAAIESLAEYFLSNRYSKDLKCKNSIQQLNAYHFGTDGLLSYSLAKILRALWLNEPTDLFIRDFRHLISHFNENYRMSTQQDAQELLVWLLDMIHEDLNMGTARKYGDLKSGESEEDLAESARDNHLRVHRSIITHLFGAQFRSSIQCSNCKFIKLNFDPYMCVSLQVPQDTRRPVFVTVSSCIPRKVVKFGLNVERNGRINDVKECISREINIPLNRILMLELNKSGINSVMSNSTSILDLHLNEVNAVGLPLCENSMDQVCIVFVIGQVDNSLKNYDSIRLSEPFVCRIQQNSSYRAICIALLKAIDLWKMPHFDDEFIETLDHTLFNIRIVFGASFDNYLNPNMVLPLHSKVVQSAISNAMWLSDVSLPVLPVILEFRKSFLINFDPFVCDSVVFHQSCNILEENFRIFPATLEQCIKEFTSAETIEWCCENCYRNEAEKILKFRSLPNILVFHFKRFRQLSDGSMIKLDRAIQFPIDGLDLSPYVYQFGITPMKLKKKVEVELSGNRGSRSYLHGNNRENAYNISDETLFVDTCEVNEYIYDLFAIVYHRGETINSGHYTSATRNPIDGKWRLYDDHVVQLIEPFEVGALNTSYILFYEKRTAHKHSSFSGHSSTESGIQDHWFNRLCTENRKRQLVPYNMMISKDPEKKLEDFGAKCKSSFCRDDAVRHPFSPSYRDVPLSSSSLSMYAKGKHTSDVLAEVSDLRQDNVFLSKFNNCTNTIV